MTINPQLLQPPGFYPSPIVSHQIIGRGTFVGQWTVEPPSSPQYPASNDNADILSQLQIYIKSGLVPAPTVDVAGNTNTYYSIFLPHGKPFTQEPNTTTFCGGGGCAFHDRGKNPVGPAQILYSIFPDYQTNSDCHSCSAAATVFESTTVLASHELAETITDPFHEDAWTDVNGTGDYYSGAELADVCQLTPPGVSDIKTIVGGDGFAYKVQTLYSNTFNNCIATKPLRSASADPGGYVRADNINSVVHRATTGAIHELALKPGAQWESAQGDLTAISGGPSAAGKPAAFRRSDGINAVVYRDMNGHVWQLSLQLDGTWQSTDLMVAAKVCTTPGEATCAAGDPTGYVRQDGTNVVVYRDVKNQIGEIAFELGKFGIPLVAASTLVAEAPTAGGDPSVYIRSDGADAVLYRSTSDEIVELSHSVGLPWQARNVTTATLGVAPPAAGNPAGFVRADGINAVVYRTTANEVEELWKYNPGIDGFDFAWIPDNLTADAQAPSADGDPAPYVRSDGVTTVVYRTGTSQIEELSSKIESSTNPGYLGRLGPWKGESLTKVSHALESYVPAADPFGYIRGDGTNAVVFKTAANHVIEFALPLGRSWEATDVTTTAGETP